MRLKAKELGVLFFIIFTLAISTIFTQNLTNNDAGSSKEEINVDNNLKTAGSWDLQYLHIDDSGMSGNGTWSYINSTYTWCNGAGTWNNPYIIENITINGGGTGNCILIGNSSVPFIIRNCTLYNAESNDGYAGIKLDKVNNSRIIENNCSNNGKNGIMLLNGCINNTISNNTAHQNTWSGITLSTNCNKNLISNNSVSDNSKLGIEIAYNCNNNTIINNNATNYLSQDRGINLYNSCNYNKIIENNIHNNLEWGIGVQISNNNTVKGNNITNTTNNSNQDWGIYLGTAQSNYITENTIKYSSLIGIHVGTSCFYNIIYKNILINNTLHADDSGSNNNWDNGSIGNYWDNYTGLDVNDDGIGDIPYTYIEGTSGSQDNFPIWDDGYTSKKIHIDDSGVSGNGTWAWAAAYLLWCSGSGTWADPYVIEDLTIDVGGTGEGILIGNSSVYFIIRNCIVFNAQSGGYYAGIKLINVNNSRLIDNNCSNNGKYGIMLLNGCINNTISNNIACKNGDSGIALSINCSKNIISNNSACDNNHIGIELTSKCRYNNITNNDASNKPSAYAQQKGINLWKDCSYNNISNNIIANNTSWGLGIQADSGPIDPCNNNSISGNTFINDSIGIYNQFCSYNNYTENSIINNTCGINLISEYSQNNTFYKNYFINDDTNAQNYHSSNKWDNGIIGNYWYDYTGLDVNDDGIGDTPYTSIGGSAGGQDNFPIWDDGFDGKKIHIDDSGICGNGTWAWAATFTWCSGAGTWEDPYVIEDLIIDGMGIRDCILIGNSSVYFIIRSCTLFNCESWPYYAGIRLNNVNNSRLIDNNCSNNGRSGIQLINGCNNNTISGNILCNNVYDGICIYSGSFNNISNNFICNNSVNGIEIIVNSNNNTIIKNELYGPSQQCGIAFNDNCFNNTISNNLIYKHTQKGIFVGSDSCYNTISNNTINIVTETGSYGHGLHFLSSSNYNTITRNNISKCNNKGVLVGGCTWNIFYNNSFINNSQHISSTTTLNYWDNGVIGNYYDTYTGIDKNDDGIGDTPYVSGNVNDTLPIWWDAPVFTVDTPTNGSIFKDSTIPEFNITIQEGVRHTSWYSLYSKGQWSKNYNFTTNGTIDSELWYSIPSGTVTIRFFVNDSRGEITYFDISIIRELSAGEQVDDDDDDDDDDNLPLDFSFILIILAAIGSAITLGGGLVYKKRKSRIGERIKESTEIAKGKIKDIVDDKLKVVTKQIGDTLKDAQGQIEEKAKGALPKEKAFNSLIKKTKNLSEEALNAKEKANFDKARDKWAESLGLITEARAMAMILKPESVPGIDKVIKSLNENIQNLNIEKAYQGAAEKIEMANKHIDSKNYEAAQGTLKKAKIALLKSIEVAKQVKAEPILKNLQKVQSDIEDTIKNYNSGKLNLIKPLTYKLVDVVAIAETVGAMLIAQPGLKLKAKQEEAPPKELTEEEKKELQKTEEEIAVKREEFICVVHKGEIKGDDIYLCPYCHTLYCTKCAKTLKEQGESCWSCGSEITVSSMIRVESKVQQKIQDLEKNLELLKNTIKMLDDNFYSGAIDEAEYNSMKAPAMKKIAGIITKIKELKEKSITKQKSKDIDVSRGGDWKNEGNQSVFYYKVKVKNISEYVITNVQILLTSIPAGLQVKTDRYRIESLKPDTYESPTFKLIATESCVGNVVEAIVTFTDPKGKTNTLQVKPFEIRYVCNLLIPKQVSKEEFKHKTENMEIKVLSIESDIPLSELEKRIKPLVSDCNFALMPPEDEQSDEIRIIEGFAEGLYDKEEVAFSIELSKESEGETKVNVKAMSMKIDKLTDLIRDFNFKLDDIKSDTQIIKDYTSQLEDIFDKTEDIETLLKESLGSDFAKIKRSWQDFKDGKIGRGELISQGLKLIGKKFAKNIVQKFF